MRDLRKIKVEIQQIKIDILELKNSAIVISNNINNGNQLIISGIDLIKISSKKLEGLNAYINYLNSSDL